MSTGTRATALDGECEASMPMTNDQKECADQVEGATPEDYPPDIWEAIDWEKFKKGEADLPDAVSVRVSRKRWMLINFTFFSYFFILFGVLAVSVFFVEAAPLYSLPLPLFIIFISFRRGFMPHAFCFMADKPILIISKTGLSFPHHGVSELPWGVFNKIISSVFGIALRFDLGDGAFSRSRLRASEDRRGILKRGVVTISTPRGGAGRVAKVLRAYRGAQSK